MSAELEDDRDHVGRRLRTVEQCALHRRCLRLTCRRCRAVRILDAVAVWWLFQQRGWIDDLVAAAGRFACSACGTIGGTAARPRIEVVRGPPQGEQLPYSHQREWKRFVSRYRS